MQKFKKILKISSILLSIILTLILVFLIYWYITTFHAYKKDIDLGIKGSKLELGEDISQIYKLSTIAYKKHQLLSLGTRSIFLKFRHNHNNHKHSGQALNKALWKISIDFWYSEKEIFYIWAKYYYFYGAEGLNDSAMKIFSKRFSDLTLKEQATILVKGYGGKYKSRTKIFDEKVDEVVKKYIHIYGEKLTSE